MKLQLYFIWVAVLVLSTVLPAMAQQAPVSGRVVDSSEGNKPLLGVSVMVKGTYNGVLTDADGVYNISAKKGDVLEFSFVGMDAQEVVVGTATVIDVAMSASSISVDEVVVVGYGVVKKSDLTGSVASIKNEDFMKSSPTSINQGLQGRLAGVAVTKNDGAPGGGVSIKIRGANSFFSGTEPLYVVDGVPLITSGTIKFSSDISENNPLAFLDPNDIASVEVLKDGSSVAIYGSRGSNGVVMITTKSGKMGNDKLRVNMQLSLSSLANKINVLGARDFAEYQNESYRNSQIINGLPIGDLPYRGNTQEDADRILGGMAPSEYDNRENYWQDQIYQTAVSKNVSLEYSGAKNGYDYVVSGSWLDQTGIIVNSGYTRYNFRVNLNKQVKDWIKLGTATTFSTALSKRQTTSTKDMDTGVVNAALYYFPTYSKETAPDGSKFQMIANPHAYTQTLNQNKSYDFYTSNYMNISLCKGLIFRSVLAYKLSMNTANVYLPRTIPEGAQYPGYAAIGNANNQTVTWDNLLMYNRSFGKHSINATIGTSWQSTNSYSVNTFNSGFGRDDNNGWLIGDGTKLIKPNSYKAENAMFSYIFRAAYTYASKYNLTLTMRRDASSVFAENHKAAFFPSIGVAWTLTNENFAKDLHVLKNLKIRYSYGSSGNAGIGPYGSLANFVGANAQLGEGTVSGFAPDFYNPGNPDLKWETTKQHDLGIDLSLTDRVRITFDYYNKKTTDILQNLAQPASMGIVHVLSNIGDVKNTGFEFAINADIIQHKDFNLNVFANIATNKNEITKLNNNDNDRIVPMEPFVLEKGRPIGQLFGYVEDGIWNSREEVINSKQFQNKYPHYSVNSDDPATEIEIRKTWLGEVRYQDLDGNDQITTNDRTYIGDVNPDFNYGFGLNLNYKNFEFSCLFDGVSGGKILNMRLVKFMNIGGYSNTTPEDLSSAWRPETGGTNPKVAYISTRNNYYSSRYLEDASYLKLRNITISYSFKNPIKHISAIRLSFTANNLLTFTDYSGYDPEINSYGSNPIYRGVDVGGFPQSREFIFGLNVTF